jgi:hypothetical protein
MQHDPLQGRCYQVRQLAFRRQKYGFKPNRDAQSYDLALKMHTAVRDSHFHVVIAVGFYSVFLGRKLSPQKPIPDDGSS